MNRIRSLFSVLTVLLVALCASCVQAQPTANNTPWMAVISPDNSLEFTFYKANKPVGKLGFTGWAPNWGWRGVEAKARATGNELNASALFESNKEAGEIVDINLRAWQSGPRALSFTYTLKADKQVPLTLLVATFGTLPGFQDGQAIITQTDGQPIEWPLSLANVAGGGTASKIAFQSKAAGEYGLTLDPPTPVVRDGAVRVVLASEKFEAGTKSTTLTFNFPENVTLLAKESDLAHFTKTMPQADWFPLVSTNNVEQGALGFGDWLDKPAGKHGGVQQVGDHFEFADKTPVKFWGTNLAYGSSAPDKPVADFTAARFAKWGVNAVRMHKFQGTDWAGIGDPNDGTKVDPAKLEKFDYFASKLAENGVYYGWSHSFKFEVRPGNRDKLLAYDEIANNLKGDTYGFINFAEDVQDLMIEYVVNLLKHQNPHTGKTYATDPALAFIELQNEDDIFFYTSEGALNACPTYKKRFMERYAGWLKQKYGTDAALRAAWGDALKDGENIAAANIEVQANPWFFSEDHLPGQTGGNRQRLLDNAAFFHDVQNKFYSRFVKAIRDAGYQGPLIGSPWQAPSGLPQYYNLRSDALVGYVDRHNYFGEKLSDSMLAKPGSGTLSTGLQQVAGHPFGMSEWITVYPSLYSAESPVLKAAYGLGLQGWDSSYIFQSGTIDSQFAPTVGNFPWGIWNADTPTQIGQFPILARMLARGDVKEGDVISVRRVSPQELASGKLGFSDKVTQQGDVKSFGGSVPEAALAAGRTLVEFTDTPQATTLPDMSKYQAGSVVRSTTGQLVWDASDGGYFTIDTPGTKGLVGFAAGKTARLGNVQIKLDSPYASILLTAADKNTDLATAKRALLSVVARNSNSGMTYFELDQRVLENGQGPILLEPVKATLTFEGRAVTAVNILDHDGLRTGRTLPVKDGVISIDGAQDKALYYEIVF